MSTVLVAAASVCPLRLRTRPLLFVSNGPMSQLAALILVGTQAACPWCWQLRGAGLTENL